MKIVVVVFLTAAAMLAFAASPRSESTGAVEVAEIGRLREAWVQNWNARQLPALVSVYAPDAILLPPNGLRLRGRDAIANYWRRVLATAAGSLVAEPKAVDISGELAYESGGLSYAETTTGETRRREGSYLVVLRRQPDGRWLIVQHAYTEALLKGLVEDQQRKARPNPQVPVDQ